MPSIPRILMIWLVPLGMLVPNFSSAADWPTEGGSNLRTYATDETLAIPLAIQWTYQAAAAPRLAFTSAEGRLIENKLISHRIRFDDAFRTVIVDGRVYFGSTVDHQLHCHDLRTGKQLWTCFTGGPVRLSPTIVDGKVFFGSDDGHAYCVDAANGQILWQRRVAPLDEWILARGELISKWPVRTGLMQHNNVVYMGAGIFPHEDIYLYGVDPTTGRQVWSQENVSAQDAGRNDLSPQGYLLAQDNLLIVPSGGSLPGVFDIQSSKLLHKRSHSWRKAAGGVVGGTRALLADGQLYTSGEHHLLAMDQLTGEVGYGWFEGRQMAIQGDAAYVLTGKRLARLNRLEYAVASRKRHALEEQLALWSTELRGKEGDEAEKIRTQIRAAGEEIKQSEPVGVVWESPTTDDHSLLVAGNVAVVGGPGRVTAYSLNDGQQVWTRELEGEARGLAVADGRLLVSTDTGAIHCFGATVPATVETTSDRQAGAALEDEHSNFYRNAASEFLKRSKITAGFCLVVGAEEGRLALELARQSELKIYCVEPSLEKVMKARRMLVAAGLYGHRVVVHHAELNALPYSSYFADLIVSDTVFKEGTWPTSLKAIERHLKPVGGTLCLCVGHVGLSAAVPTSDLQNWANDSELDEQLTHQIGDGWIVSVRGPLPGAGNWSHQYGNPGNTAISSDRRIQGDLGVLWYGDPGPGEMVNRHEGAVGPLAVNGRMFVQGENTIKAYDAYNGRHLWTQENPKAIRTGVYQNQNPGNLAAGEDSLFHFVGDKCLQVDMATGNVVATHELPPGKSDGTYQWGYVAVQNGLLFGTATIRKELDAALKRRGRGTKDATDGFFAIDIASGKHLWTYAGKSISHHTIAIGPDRVFLIDSSITSEQRDELLKQDKSHLANLTGEEQELAEKRLKEADVRLTVALDMKTGEKLWEQAVDVTDCSEIGIGGGKLTMMYAQDRLVLCGANANGHYWKQFVEGDFKRRRLVTLSATNGSKLWAKDANYRNRPIIVGDRILAEPWMYSLTTGYQITREHPITGETAPWSMMRTGHHCGMLTGSESGMVLFRSGHTGFMDLNTDDGIRHFAGHRLGCWINAISANGLVMIPEASAGCVCQFSISSTIVMEPRESRRPWTIYSAVGAQTPVKHLAVNLGAPGDRKDSLGQIWFSYPRRDPYKQTALEVQLDLRPQLLEGGGFDNTNENRITPKTAEVPWVYTSWASGLEQLSLPLLGESDSPATYTIRLHFAEAREGVVEPTILDVHFNGSQVISGLNLELPVEKQLRPIVREIRNVRVERDLVIDLKALKGVAILNGVEAIRDTDAK